MTYSPRNFSRPCCRLLCSRPMGCPKDLIRSVPCVCSIRYWGEIKARLDGSRYTGRVFNDVRGCSSAESLYEDMTARPHEWAKKIGAFLGLGHSGGGDGNGDGSGDEGLVARAEAAAAAGVALGEAEARELGLASQRLFLLELAAEQRTVHVDENSHTAYFFPGSHLRVLSNETLSWMY